MACNSTAATDNNATFLPIKAYRVYAAGGVYYSIDEVEGAVQEEIFLLLPSFISISNGKDSKGNTVKVFKFTNGMKIPTSSLKSVTRKTCAIPYIQTPYGQRDIFLKVKRLGK